MHRLLKQSFQPLPVGLRPMTVPMLLLRSPVWSVQALTPSPQRKDTVGSPHPHILGWDLGPIQHQILESRSQETPLGLCRAMQPLTTSPRGLGAPPPAWGTDALKLKPCPKAAHW